MPARNAEELIAELAARGVTAVALTWVDNAGITRVKAVPTARLERAARWGVGMSPVFDVFCFDDSITTSTHIGGPVGDLRLVPDLDALRVLAAQPGWAWAPVNRLRQDRTTHPACQRSFAQRMVQQAAANGLAFKLAFEIEWFVGRRSGSGEPVPACEGPAYGMTRVVELSDYARDLLVALADQGVPVDQFHPEYAAGQLELSTAATDPVAAADRLVLARETIRAVSQAHELRVSFAPVVAAGSVGNGGHVHLSAWSSGTNMFAGGPGRYGLTGRGESMLAGLLSSLPALCAICTPSVPSYLRLVPQRWAAPYQCWGRENREAALRLITGTEGAQATAANIELKCVDGSANPYLVAGAVVAVATAAVDRGLKLPPEVSVDPAELPEGEQPPRLPQSLPAAAEALARDDVLTAALGEPLLAAFLAVRRAESELLDGDTPEQIVAASRWKY
jgi:glutamine synthetase